MRNVASTSGGVAYSGSFARATVENALKAARRLIALVRKAMAHERSRRQLAQWDERMLQDIGLEPFDVYYGWRSPARQHSKPSRISS